MFKKLLPTWFKKKIRWFVYPPNIRDQEKSLGLYLLKKTKDYCRTVGGIPESLDNKKVMNIIKKQDNLIVFSEIHQYLQTAFMPEYEKNLYEYYKQQQYLILLNFLSYPFWGPGCLTSYTEPYVEAAKRNDSLHILNYGAGIPFGLINALQKFPEKIKSFTLVDMDIIHTDLVEYILSDLWKGKKIDYIKITDPDSLPDFGERKFNFIYGKDIFEHLCEPDVHLRNMLDKSEAHCSCYFDFNDHGEKYLQHISPELSFLNDILKEYSFQFKGKINKMTEFTRSN